MFQSVASVPSTFVLLRQAAFRPTSEIAARTLTVRLSCHTTIQILNTEAVVGKV